MYDVIIIGGGPVGLAAAIECKQQSLDYVVLEKGVLVNSIFLFPTDMRFFTTAALLEIGDHAFPSTALKPDRQTALDYYRRVTELEKINIKLHHEVTKIEKQDGKFNLSVKQTHRSKIMRHEFHAKHVIVATGYFDNPKGLGGIPGEKGSNTSYYYSHPHQFFDKDIVVIGAGNSGAEAALELYRHGARVTLVHRHPKPKSTLKYWVGPDLENRLKNGEIKSLMPAQVTQITSEGVHVSNGNSSEFVGADFVFILTGFTPNVDLFRRWGITIRNDLSIPLKASNEVEDFPNLYFIGSAGHGKATNKVFIENGRIHARDAVQDIKSNLEK